jgi:hypothetical protein
LATVANALFRAPMSLNMAFFSVPGLGCCLRNSTIEEQRRFGTHRAAASSDTRQNAELLSCFQEVPNVVVIAFLLQNSPEIHED